MPAKKTTTEPITYRKKEKGTISKVWDSTGGAIENTFDIAEVGTKTLANTFRLANELLLPNIIEAKFDTQVSLTEAVMKLTELGADPEISMAYLKQDIIS